VLALTCWVQIQRSKDKPVGSGLTRVFHSENGMVKSSGWHHHGQLALLSKQAQ
jgi:hypothetical protein